MSGYRSFLVTIACAAVTFASCSRQRTPVIPNQKPVTKVSGEVFVDGKPAAGVAVALCFAGQRERSESSGRTDDDGKFVITTYVAGDGSPKGDYVVTFERRILLPPDDTIGPDELLNLYNDPKTSEFKVKVEDKALTLPRYELKVEGMEPKPDPYQLPER